eukprot:g11966.t1
MPDLFGEPDAAEVIVEIRPTQRDANRATIRVGLSEKIKGGKKPRVVATLTTRLIADLDLRVGQAWTDALAKQVEGGVGIDKAMRSAMTRLSRRAMSGWMLRDKLKTAGHSHAVIDQVLERLAELDLLDDEQFGRALVRETMARKPAGPALLKQKLFQKGIRGALADRLVAEATADTESQHDAAITFAQKKAASMRNLDATTRNRRLYGQLARRGFDPDTIRAAMDAVRSSLHLSAEEAELVPEPEPVVTDLRFATRQAELYADGPNFLSVQAKYDGGKGWRSALLDSFEVQVDGPAELVVDVSRQQRNPFVLIPSQAGAEITVRLTAGEVSAEKRFKTIAASVGKPVTLQIDLGQTTHAYSGVGGGLMFYDNQFTIGKELFDWCFKDVDTQFVHVLIRPNFEATNDNDDWKTLNPEGFDWSACQRLFWILWNARQRNPDLKVYACLYSPPAWMKANDDTAGDAGLKEGESYRLEVAEYVYAFLKHAKWKGTKIDYLCLFNEPDFPHKQDGTYYPTLGELARAQIQISGAITELIDQDPDFDSYPKYVFPETLGPGSLIRAGDESRELAKIIASGELDHLAAWGVHDYWNTAGYWPVRYKELREMIGSEDKPIWMTEWAQRFPKADLVSGMEYASKMLNALRLGASVWMAFEWAHPASNQSGLISTQWGEGFPKKRYWRSKSYYMFQQIANTSPAGGQFVQIQPVDASSTPASSPRGLEYAAIKKDGRLVVHISNDQPSSMPYSIASAGLPTPSAGWLTDYGRDFVALPEVASNGEVGRTPLEVPFTWYGTYDVRLEREGFETLYSQQTAEQPWWEKPGPDLFAEAMPNKRVAIAWHLEMMRAQPASEADGERVLDFARQMPLLVGVAGLAEAQNDEVEQLRAELAEVRAEMAQIRSESREEWLSDARRAEIEGMINDVFADANSRATLLQEGALAGIDEKGKIFLMSGDGNFNANFFGQLTFRYVWNSLDTDGARDSESLSGFQTKYAKFGVKGQVGDGWGYFLKFNTDYSGGNTFTEDAYITYKMNKKLKLLAGTAKLPFARQELIKTYNQVAADRSLVTEFFTLNRSDQVQLQYADEDLRAALAISDGGNAAFSTPFGDSSNDFAVTGRVDWMAMGDDWKSAKDEFGGVDKDALFIGAAAHFEVAEGSSAPESGLAWTVDALYKTGPLGLTAALFGNHTDNSTAADSDQYGFYAQGDYDLGNDWDVFARWEYIDDDGVSSAATDELQAVTFGVNKRFNKNVRLTADIVWIYEGDNPTADGNFSNGGELSSVPGVANAETTELEQMRAEMAQMRAEMAQLKADSQGEKMSDARRAEIEGMIADVFADANTRATLLQEGALAGIDEKGKVFLKSADGSFSMNLNGQIQSRYIWNNQDQRANESESGFQIRRVKFGAKGKIADGWSYEIKFATDRDTGDVQMEDAVIGYKFSDTLSMKTGVKKLPFARQELISSSRQVAVDRGVATEFFTLGRSDMVELTYKVGDDMVLTGALSDGGNNNFNDYNDADANDFAVTGRLDWIAIGDDWGAAKHEFGGVDESSLFIGVAGHYEVFEESAIPETGFAWTADVLYKVGPLGLTAAIFGNHTENTGGVDTDQFGGYIQAAFDLGSDWDVFGRLEYVDDDSAATEELQVATFGVNKQITKNVKFTGDVVYAFAGDNPVPDGLSTGGADSDGIGLANSFNDDEDTIAVRLQLQLLF